MSHKSEIAGPFKDEIKVNKHIHLYGKLPLPLLPDEINKLDNFIWKANLFDNARCVSTRRTRTSI